MDNYDANKLHEISTDRLYIRIKEEENLQNVDNRCVDSVIRGVTRQSQHTLPLLHSIAIISIFKALPSIPYNHSSMVCK